MYTNNMAKLFAEGGMNDEGGTVDPVSGNDVPPGSLKSEVRDDIDAKLSEGEFVIPADVVRYIGLERLMKLRDEAKQGLARMAEIGQMGNAQEVENPEALHEGDEGFESEIDDIMKEVDGEHMGEKKFAAGGFAESGTDYLAKYNIPKTSITNPALDVRAYKNAEGRVMYITFFNGKPSIPVPAGYEFAGSAGQFIAETKKTEDKKDVVTATQTIESGGDGPTGTEGASVSTGQGIGASPVGIAIGAIANAIESITNPNPVVSIAEDSIGPEGSANAAAAAANAAAVAAGLAAENSIQGDEGSVDGMDASAVASAVDDASISEGVSQGDSTNGEGGSSDGTAGGAVGDNGDGTGSYAKGGLVSKRNKKPTPARKRGIASKR